MNMVYTNLIVILDEPTAHVDPISEQTIWKTVHEKLNNCRVISIARRLDTIKNCDTMLVMREGEIAEFGTFDSLMGRDSGLLATSLFASDFIARSYISTLNSRFQLKC